VAMATPCVASNREAEQAVPNDEVQRADRNAVMLRARSRKATEAMNKEMGIYTSEEVTRPGE
jgi:hypothetical protein